MVRMRRRYVLAALLAVLAVVVSLRGVYKERRMFVCPDCYSVKRVRQWRCGGWPAPSIPLTPKRVVVEPSHICQDFFGSSHEHKWAFGLGLRYYCLGTVWGGSIFGVGRYKSQFAWQYEEDEEFRRFVAREGPRRGVSREQFVSMAALPDSLNRGAQSDAELQQLVRVRDALVRDYFASVEAHAVAPAPGWSLEGPEPPIL